MEYTFKNNLGDPITVIVSEYSLSCLVDGKELMIPYANIHSIRLSRSGKNFFTTITPSGQAEIQIVSNSFYGEEKDGSQYTSFVRILHVHLREKSLAYYVCGNKIQNILFAACASVLVAFGFSHSISKFSFYQSDVLSITLTFLAIGVIAIVNRNQFPNAYKPENIPSQFLPAF